MMKKFSALVLSLMLALLAVVGNSSEVRAATENTSAQATGQVDSLDGDAVKLVLLDDNGAETTAATDLEIGDTVTLGVKIDAGKLTGKIVSLTARFSYDEEIFNTVQTGDVAVVDSSVAEEDRDDLDKFQFIKGWDSASSQISLSAKLDSSNAPTAQADGIMLQVTLTVRKAVEETTDFRLANIHVETESNVYESGTDGTGDVTCQVTNAMYGKRTTTLSMYGKDETADSALTVAAGGSVNVPIYVKENTGFNALKVTVEYNKDYFSYNKVTLSSELRAYADLSVDYDSSGKVTVSLITSSSDIRLKDLTKLFDFNFTAKVSTTVGTIAAMKVTVNQVNNVSDVTMDGESYEADGLTPIAQYVYSRNVEVTDSVELGDVNADGNVNLVDAAYLLQYYNGVRYLNSEQIKLGDVNGSGTITLVDVLMIMKKYNGESITFTPAPTTP